MIPILVYLKCPPYEPYIHEDFAPRNKRGKLKPVSYYGV